MAQATLALVVPCYRPGVGWHYAFRQNVEALQQALPGVELAPVLVVDGISDELAPDQFKMLAKAIPHVRMFFLSRNCGKGFALRYGVRHVEADYYLYTDVDFPFELASMVAVVRRLMRPGGPDIVVGVKAADHYGKVPKVRRLVSRLLRAHIWLLFRLPHSDTQTGLKGFNRKGRAVFLQTRIPRYLFDLEFLLRAHGAASLRVEWKEVKLRPQVVFTSLDSRIIRRELHYFGWLWWQSVKGFDARKDKTTSP